MPSVIGTARKYHRKFKFLVEMDGFNDSRWQKCSELSAEIAKIEQWEGGALIADKALGRVTVSDVTIERGATEDEDCYNWFNLCANMAANAGAVDDECKKNGDVVQQDRDGKSLRRWNLQGAAPIKFVAGEWDNTADENVMESLTMMIDLFARKAA